MLKADAPRSKPSIFHTLDTSHLDMSVLKDVSSSFVKHRVGSRHARHIHIPLGYVRGEGSWSNIPHILVTFDTSHLEMSPLTDVALWNMLVISVTLDTPHLDMSVLKIYVPSNIQCILVTLDRSHFEMSAFIYVAKKRTHVGDIRHQINPSRPSLRVDLLCNLLWKTNSDKPRQTSTDLT